MADRVVVVVVFTLFCDAGAKAAEKDTATTLAMIIWISIRFIFYFVIM